MRLNIHLLTLTQWWNNFRYLGQMMQTLLGHLSHNSPSIFIYSSLSFSSLGKKGCAKSVRKTPNFFFISHFFAHYTSSQQNSAFHTKVQKCVSYTHRQQNFLHLGVKMATRCVGKMIFFTGYGWKIMNGGKFTKAFGWLTRACDFLHLSARWSSSAHLKIDTHTAS